MKFILKLSLTLLIGFFVTSCYYDEVIEIDQNIEVGEVLFAKDLIPIFNESCNTSGCHSGSVAPNLLPDKAYNELINGAYIDTANPENSELYQWMLGNRSIPMPLSGSDAEFNAKVKAWIEQGALNN